MIPDSEQARAIAEWSYSDISRSDLNFTAAVPCHATAGAGPGHGIQYLLSLLLFAVIALALAQSLSSAIVLASALAMSSTAIGIKLLAERNELSAASRQTGDRRPVVSGPGGRAAVDSAASARGRRPIQHDGTGWLVLKVVVLLGLLLGFGQPVLRAWFASWRSARPVSCSCSTCCW